MGDLGRRRLQARPRSDELRRGGARTDAIEFSPTSRRGGRPDDPIYHPDITAPGVRIVSARASTGVAMAVLDLNEDALACGNAPAHVLFYTCASGTSMAAPHVAGVIALLEEAAGGSLTPDQALEVITRTARPLPRYALWEVGAGYLDALAAVEMVSR